MFLTFTFLYLTPVPDFEPHTNVIPSPKRTTPNSPGTSTSIGTGQTNFAGIPKIKEKPKESKENPPLHFENPGHEVNPEKPKPKPPSPPTPSDPQTPPKPPPASISDTIKVLNEVLIEKNNWTKTTLCQSPACRSWFESPNGIDYFYPTTRTWLEKTPIHQFQMGQHAQILCNNEDKMRMAVYSRRDDAGFGSHLTLLNGAIKWATDHNRVFVHDAEGYFVHSTDSFCRNRIASDCFFENASICYPHASIYHNQRLSSADIFTSAGEDAPIARIKGSMGLEMDIPLEQWNNHYPFLQGLCRFMMLNERTRNLLQQVIYEALLPADAELLAQGGYIAVHIRRGDKIIFDMGYISTAEFADAVRAVHRNATLIGEIPANHKVVFLMTDSLKEVNALKLELGSDWRVVTLNWKRKISGYDQYAISSYFGEAIGLLADLSISSRATGVVVTLQSNVSILMRSLWVCNEHWNSPIINIKKNK